MSEQTRRDFLRTTAVAGTALATNLGMLANVHAAGSDVIKVGLIGCGGRGSGAIDNVLHAAPNIQIVALGDVFKDRLDDCRRKANKFTKDEKVKALGNTVDITDDRCFVGFDAYEKVIACSDYVMLATPPGFRPLHIAATIAAGKNLFTEKPVATDATGIRQVLAAYDEANKRNVCVVAGTQRRHMARYLEAMNLVQDGMLGEITGGRCYWNQGNIWAHARKPDWSDMVYQLRNWYHFTWLCGDHIVEQHVHNLDVINWAIGQHPVRAVGMGGRQVNMGLEYGQSFDHFAVDYEYPNGVHVLSMCRQIEGCESSVSEALSGTNGHAFLCDGRPITFKSHKDRTMWSRSKRDEDVDPYVQEHTDLIAHIRGGQHINELKNVAESTLTAIMGRMSAYTGKALTWDKALHSREHLMPSKVDWDTTMPTAGIPVPGKTPLV
jgi:myo-inositol 2-dehydrogenase/D-chiro-inositol 1-dehydrogenase